MIDTDENGYLPEGWSKAQLGDIADLSLGKMLDRARRIRGKSLPYLRNANVRWGEFDLGCLLQMPFEDHEIERLSLRHGDLLVCEGGEPGRAAVWHDPGRVILFQKALLRVRPKLGIDPRWIMYSLRFDASVGALAEHFTGSTIQHFTRKAARKYQVRLPPLAEQKRIVERVEALLGRVNAARERLDKVPAILKHFRQSVLASACDGDLTEEWRASRGLPEWDRGRLADTGARVQIGPFGSLLHRGDYAPNGIPLVNPTHIKDGAIVPTDEARVSPPKAAELALYRLRTGDVVLGRRGEMGRAAVVRQDANGFICGTGSLFVRDEGRKWVPHFLCAVLRSPETVSALSDAAVGSTMINLNQAIVADLSVPLVTLDEQVQVVRRVEAMFRRADEIEIRIASAKARAEKLTQAILAKAFRGELVPTEAELARREGREYESAPALIARISATQDQGKTGASAERSIPRPRAAKART